VRFTPRSTANVLDLDQIVTATGGFLALLFSLHDALKERREMKRVAEAEERHSGELTESQLSRHKVCGLP
jgi:hypothetical protein